MYRHKPPRAGPASPQHSNGHSYFGGLTAVAPPLGRRTMTSTDGLTWSRYAAACSVLATESVLIKAPQTRNRR
jgi:hypothetical protein